MKSLSTRLSSCVVCGDDAYRRLGLIGPTCRECLEKACQTDDYMEWYEERL